jgi:hypothetical protein
VGFAKNKQKEKDKNLVKKKPGYLEPESFIRRGEPLAGTDKTKNLYREYYHFHKNDVGTGDSSLIKKNKDKFYELSVGAFTGKSIGRKCSSKEKSIKGMENMAQSSNIYLGIGSSGQKFAANHIKKPKGGAKKF